MSKTRRRPVNHGRHADPAEIRRRSQTGGDDAATRRRRNEIGVDGAVPPPAAARRRNEAGVDGAGPSTAAVERRDQAGEGGPGTPSGTRRRRTAPAAPDTVSPDTVSPDTVSPDGVAAGEQSTMLAGHPPWTTAGDFLRATAVEDAPARFGTPSGPVDDYARRVWHTAFGLAVRRRFAPDSPLPEISRTVTAAVHAHESAGLPTIDAEMLVRAELGEQVPVDELDPALLIGVHLLVFATLVDELALRDGELDDLVTEAERLAALR